MYEVHVLADHEEASLSAAAWLCYHATRRAGGGFSMAVSGGKTPLKLYEILGRDPYRAAMPWGSIRLFWADERCVPPDHPDSNYAALSGLMLRQAPMDPRYVHRIEGERGAAEAARDYVRKLKEYFGNKRELPCLDLVVLGVGADGHVASIFPGHDAHDANKEWAVAVPAGKGAPAVQRVSLTLPVLCAAKTVMFLVTGRDKREVVRTLLDGSDRTLPAARIKGPRLVWFLDHEAAGE